jgi:hypothetical protein
MRAIFCKKNLVLDQYLGESKQKVLEKIHLNRPLDPDFQVKEQVDDTTRGNLWE